MSLLDTVKQSRAAVQESMDALIATVELEERSDLTADEDTKFTSLKDERAKFDARIADLEAEEVRREASAAANVRTGVAASGAAVTREAPVYARDKHDTSYFRDLYAATHKGDADAQDRLRRSTAIEARALGNTGGVGGSGGEFAPPIWLGQDYVALARPGRVAADLFTHATLPAGVSSVNIPKVATGTTVATQTTQNTALSQTDMTTTSLSSNISTVGGKQVVALQLLEQSPVPFDSVIMQDLALAYAGQLDIQALTGVGTGGVLRGLTSTAGLTTVAYTTGSPTVAGVGQFYSLVASAISSVYSTRFLPADTILMHPRRWAWICSAFDTTNRPLVVPAAHAYNPIATDDVNVAQGLVGSLQGLDVYVDPNVPINIGAGTNQDVVYVFRRGDIFLWESASPTMETFTQPYADSMGVLFRLYAYSALIPDRYGSSIVKIAGTGLVTPVF